MHTRFRMFQLEEYIKFLENGVIYLFDLLHKYLVRWYSEISTYEVVSIVCSCNALTSKLHKRKFV